MKLFYLFVFVFILTSTAAADPLDTWHIRNTIDGICQDPFLLAAAYNGKDTFVAVGRADIRLS